MKIGDSVKVKAGVLEPDTEKFEIGGWQGRIVEIDTLTTDEGTLINIVWDKVTLQQIPPDYIIQSEIEGLGWETMVLFESDLEMAVSRDTVEEVKSMQEQLSEKYYWSNLGEDGLRITQVLEGTDRKDETTCFETWMTHLNKSLIFPFQAEVMESEEIKEIKEGTIVEISALSNVDDRFGILATIKTKDSESFFPLCDLDVTDNRSANYQFINDYSVWFANR